MKFRRLLNRDANVSLVVNSCASVSPKRGTCSLSLSFSFFQIISNVRYFTSFYYFCPHLLKYLNYGILWHKGIQDLIIFEWSRLRRVEPFLRRFKERRGRKKEEGKEREKKEGAESR